MVICAYNSISRGAEVGAALGLMASLVCSVCSKALSQKLKSTMLEKWHPRLAFAFQVCAFVHTLIEGDELGVRMEVVSLAQTQ